MFTSVKASVSKTHHDWVVSPAQTLMPLVRATAELQVMKLETATVEVMEERVTAPSPKHAAE